MTDIKSGTRFFSNKMIPPPFWNASDFAIQFNFTTAHIPGKMNTAAEILSRLEIDPNEEPIPKIREDVPTEPNEVNNQSTGITQKNQIFFPTEDPKFPSEEQLWQSKQEESNAIHMESPVITVSHCYRNENCRNTLREPFNKVPRTLI